jgi:hypothetical protein
MAKKLPTDLQKKRSFFNVKYVLSEEILTI